METNDKWYKGLAHQPDHTHTYKHILIRSERERRKEEEIESLECHLVGLSCGIIYREIENAREIFDLRSVANRTMTEIYPQRRRRQSNCWRAETN